MLSNEIFVNKNLHLQKEYLQICFHLLIKKALLFVNMMSCAIIMHRIFAIEEHLPE